MNFIFIEWRELGATMEFMDNGDVLFIPWVTVFRKPFQPKVDFRATHPHLHTLKFKVVK